MVEKEMKKVFRYLVKESDNNPQVWNVYKCYGDNAAGQFVASVTDRETLNLLISAPAMRQLKEGLRPSVYRYTLRSLRDFSAAFVGFLRKVS